MHRHAGGPSLSMRGQGFESSDALDCIAAHMPALPNSSTRLRRPQRCRHASPLAVASAVHVSHEPSRLGVEHWERLPR
eukprot:2594641-Rhodomonas_salina.2